MKIIIDADACPVVDITVRTAKERSVECIIVCDNTHFIEKDGAETIVVDKGADSADCRIAKQSVIARELDIPFSTVRSIIYRAQLTNTTAKKMVCLNCGNEFECLENGRKYCCRECYFKHRYNKK